MNLLSQPGFWERQDSLLCSFLQQTYILGMIYFSLFPRES